MIPAEGREPKDLTPVEYDVPSDNLSGQDDYGISPDGKEIAYSMNTDKDQALSTNSDIYLQTIADGKTVKITNALGADNTLRYSPDGRFIAYRSQAIFGNEAAKRDLMLYDRTTKKTINLTEQMDNWVGDIFWSLDGKVLYFTILEKGNIPLLSADVQNQQIKRVLEGHFTIADGSVSANGRYIAYLKSDIANPNEVFLLAIGTKKELQVTNVNKELKESVYFSPAEEHWVPSADGIKIHTFIVKPPNFEKEKQYGMLFTIHGGPQGMYSNSFRTDYQVFSGAGYVLVFSNPRGSTGYGQKFTDEINQDWAGKCYDDLMRVIDYALSLGYVDKKRICAYGSSFGGYMVDWFEGHTDRFACLVSHAGPYNLESMYATTEELWFAEWDLGGPFWKNPKMYETMSPHKFVQNFKTPMLITHGEIDYRVPITESMQLFTALQRNNVPSKFLWFPNEGHGIRKLQNREYWYKTLLEWFHTWMGVVP
ncbi:MAG: hypothetical protein A2Y62_01275 [Candidatus Fischerbacteria bacterium RBG_13_37_8]|uniref:Peptidase S9 prolyl oligopeptidase catalytic domain-containing protein n=1 Tax=Candidatus Fischerbacteria bacterium RBG_13_37_8 TaxID=1817863 RepID=A0A1F5VYP0_9BACT|nr:MAG: hypothetical protein A2Y62_01275 [Candidatus Fischerbacteria bacterium RBG_13_37_8]